MQLNNDYGIFEHSIEVYDPISRSLSPTIKFTTKNTTADIQFHVKDLIGDDHGLTHDYSKPTDPGFRKQLDISQVDILAGGKTLQLTLTMEELKSDWVAANLFDHVAFTIFFDLPLTKGLNILPKLNSDAPKDFHWDYGHQFFGWGNSMFGTVGADKEHFGSTDAKSATLVVNIEERTITVTYDANEFGIQSWLGSKIYITTWDLTGEGEYRPLSEKPSRWNFSSPNNSGPLIWEAINILKVDRLDHSLNAVEDMSLIAEINRRKLCLTGSPVQRSNEPEPQDIPRIKFLFQHGVCISLHTDDPEEFASGYLTQMLLNFQQAGEFSKRDMVRFMLNAFKSLWLPEKEKQAYIDRLIIWAEKEGVSI